MSRILRIISCISPIGLIISGCISALLILSFVAFITGFGIGSPSRGGLVNVQSIGSGSVSIIVTSYYPGVTKKMFLHGGSEQSSRPTFGLTSDSWELFSADDNIARGQVKRFILPTIYPAAAIVVGLLPWCFKRFHTAKTKENAAPTRRRTRRPR